MIHMAAAENVRPRCIPWTHTRAVLMIHTVLSDTIHTLILAYLYQAASVLSRSIKPLVRSSLVPYVRINVERSIPVL